MKAIGAALACSACMLLGTVSASEAQIVGFTIDCEPVEVNTSTEGDAAESFDEKLKKREDCLLPRIPNYSTALVELALTQKTLADERYITQQNSEAATYYESALKTLLSVREEAKIKSPEYQLLLYDIEYRNQLLASGSDFWGTGNFKSPANPVKLLQELIANYGDFSTIVNEIEALRTSRASDGVTQATLRAVYQEHSANRQAEIWSIDKQSEIATRSSETRNHLLQRLDDNQRRQTEIAAEIREAWDSADKLGDQLTDLVVSTIGAAVGVPPGLTSAITSEGPLEARLLQAGTALLSSPDFKEAVVGLTPNVEELFDIVEVAHQFSVNAEAAQQVLEGAKRAIERKSIRDIIGVGTAVWATLSDAEKTSIRAKVEAAAEGTYLLELAMQHPEAAITVASAVTDLAINSKSIQEIAGDVLADAHFDGAWPIVARALKASAHLGNAREIKATVVAAIMNANAIALSNELLTGGPLEEAVATLATEISKFSGGSVGDLATVIAAIESDRVKVTIAVNGNLEIAIDKATIVFNPAEISPILRDALPKVLGGKTTPFLEDLITATASVDGPETYFRELLIAGDMGIGNLMPDTTQETLYAEQIMQAIEDMDRAQILDCAAQFLVGQSTGAKLNKEVERSATTVIQPAIRKSQASQAKPEEQAAQMLVSSAVPYGQFATAAVGAVKLLSQMDLAIQKGKELYAEDKELVKEQLHIVDMIVGTDSARALAEYDREIAKARSYGAAESSAQYLRAISRSTEKMTDAQAQARLRVPLAVFYAEQMRRNFDELNYALSLWVGSDASPRGTIERLVREDPQYVRFALDDQIQLYQWLVRDFEGDRTDLRALSNHWRQVVALSLDVCRRIGCSSDAAVLGPVKQTEEISVKKLVGEAQWGRFERWRANPDRETFSLNMLITPDDGLIEADLELVRLVDVQLGVKGEDGHMHQPQTLSLVHPGVSYVQTKRMEFAKEFYPFVTKSDLTWAEGFNLEALRTRWARSSDLSQRSFEGRGMYSEWQLVVRRNDLRKAPQDFILRFAYQYKQPGLTFGEQSQKTAEMLAAEDAMRLTGYGVEHIFTRADVALVASISECGVVQRAAVRTNEYRGSPLGRDTWICEE